MNPMALLTSFRQHLSMPLLTRELAEQAARRKTYVIRFIYAALLFGVGLFIIYGRGASGGVASLGQGREMFLQMFRLQLAAILLVLPATCAGALAGEKERESLSLLLLTTIPAPLIVLQKLLSRVIPMLAFVILSFPLMATAYSFGGVPTAQLFSSIMFLLALTLFVGSVAIMSSAYCRTTIEAYVMTYLILLLCSLFIVPSMPTTEIGSEAELSLRSAILWGILKSCGMQIPFAFVALLLATSFLYHRAFVPPKNFLLAVFRELDQIFNGMNQVTGGVILVKDADPYPQDDPISWRETSKRSLGTFRYLFRVLVVIEVPILFVAQSVRYDSTRMRTGMTTLLYLVWIVALVLTAVHSASVISSERSRQTLDVLLVSPMTGREMISRKLSGVLRLFWMLLVPFSTIFLFQQWFYGFRWDLRYLLLHFGSVFAVLTLVRWLGMMIGLQARNQMRATMLLLSILAAAVAMGPALNYMMDLLGYPRSYDIRNADGVWTGSTIPILRQLTRVSPAEWLIFLEEAYPSPGGRDFRWSRFGSLGGVLLLYGLAAWAMRAWVLSSADAFLGRVRPGAPVPATLDEPPGIPSAPTEG